VTEQLIDQIMVACDTWAQMHHRTRLTIQEAGYIRGKLKARLSNRMQPKPEELELVQLAHRLANSAVANRRDQAQRGEHARMVRA
jgi:hypothetical protein